MLKDLIVKAAGQTTPATVGSRIGLGRMASPPQGDLAGVAYLQKEVERYSSEAAQAASEEERNYFIAMARLSETMAANEKMRTWLDRAIQELKTERGSPVQSE